jgi:hypothetical protein
VVDGKIPATVNTNQDIDFVMRDFDLRTSWSQATMQLPRGVGSVDIRIIIIP